METEGTHHKGGMDMAWYCEVCGYVYDEEEPPEKCPQCWSPKEKFRPMVEEAEDMGEIKWEEEHKIGIAKNMDPESLDMLREQFRGECVAAGSYAAAARQAEREGYPEVAAALRRIALEEMEHAARFSEMLGEGVADSTSENLRQKLNAEKASASGKYEMAAWAKQIGFDGVYDILHEICKDEARHGNILAGIQKRYFGK